MRRRQRRMRSWWRHEQVSIAAAVATALHHSAQRGGGVARRPTGTEDSGNKGTRPGVLKDPQPQLLDAVLAYRAAGEPSVATPLLAALAAEGIDSSSLRFLTASALKARREEEEKLKREEQEELNSLWAVPVERRPHQQMQRITCLLLNRGAKKKRKKRRKKKLPKTSSSRGPAHRRQRLWHTRPAGFPGDDPLRDVFPYLSTGPDARHHGRFGPEEPFRSYAAALFVDNGTGMYMAGFLVTLHLALCSCVFAWPKMLRIMAGIQSSRPFSLSTAVACSWSVSLVTMRCSSRCALFSCRQAQDARHHGRTGSEGQLPRGVQRNWIVFLRGYLDYGS